MPYLVQISLEKKWPHSLLKNHNNLRSMAWLTGKTLKQVCVLLSSQVGSWHWGMHAGAPEHMRRCKILVKTDQNHTLYKNWTIQKNFYTALFTPLPIMLYNCCYNWCILDCSCCDALQFFCCWTLDYIFLCSVCSMYVLCVSNPTVAAKSNKPLLPQNCTYNIFWLSFNLKALYIMVTAYLP